MSKKEDDILEEAKSRYKRCSEWESKFRQNYLFDTRFANGDSSNMYQWQQDDEQETRLTVNKTMPHCLQIINDQRQNQSQIEIRPVGGGASFDAASVFEGIVRHIEANSNAQSAYSCATDCQVIGGIGYWRVITDYQHDDSFDQEIYIKRVADPLSIYLDPDISEYDGSDARFAFVEKDMSREEYEEQYKGDFDDLHGLDSSPLGAGSIADQGWEDEDHIKVVEYFRKVYKPDKLHELDNGMMLRESEAKAMERAVQGRQEGEETHLDTLNRLSQRKRNIQTPVIEWYLIAGSKILDSNIWPGKFIPLVRVVGRETVIDKQLDRKGHVRALIDPQRIYNFWSSSAVEQVALIGKTPYIGPSEAIQGYEEEWAAANRQNKAILPYNAYTEDGQALNPPQRVTPPQMAPAYLEGLKISQQEMMFVTGQYEANLGEKSNEVSGRAVQERRRNGQNSVYHFIDHFAQAIQFTGKILIDLIPKIYDVERVIKILAEDGTQRTVQIDPNHPQAHTQVQDPNDEDNFDPQKVTAIFNPTVGTYSVIADIGPAFETRRQETFQAITQLASNNQTLMPLIGDLLFKSSDFFLADEMSRRLKNMIPPKALGQDVPDPQIQQLQSLLAKQHEQMSQAQQETVALKQQLAQEKMKSVQHDPQREWYDSETKRMQAIGAIDPQALKPIIRDMVSQVLNTDAGIRMLHTAIQDQMMPGSDHALAAHEHANQMAQDEAQRQHEAGMADLQHNQALEQQGVAAQNAAQSQAADQQHQAEMAQQAQEAAQQSGDQE